MNQDLRLETLPPEVEPTLQANGDIRLSLCDLSIAIVATLSYKLGRKVSLDEVDGLIIYDKVGGQDIAIELGAKEEDFEILVVLGLESSYVEPQVEEAAEVLPQAPVAEKWTAARNVKVFLASLEKS